MGKHARKKQKVSQSDEIEPLGAALDLAHESAKDDEELRLESFLFGSADDIPVDSVEQPLTVTEDVFIDDGQWAEPVSSTKPSAWTDSDDTNLQVSLATDK